MISETDIHQNNNSLYYNLNKSSILVIYIELYNLNKVLYWNRFFKKVSFYSVFAALDNNHSQA